MLENVGREAMGLPRREGMTERAIESRGEQVPELLGRAMDVGEQALGGGVLEGGSAALLGAAPARGTGAIAQGLEAWSKRSKASTAAKNVERGRALREAGRVPAATLQRLALEAEAEKGAAGRAKADILRTAPGDLIPIGAIIDRVRKNMAGQIGATPDRGRIAKRVKERFAAVIEAASEGAISGRKTTYNVRELDWAKTRFDRAARGKISESTKGIAHDPDMDEQIANALREEVAERVPEIVPANLAYQGAREATIGARKRLARETSPSFQRQREAEDLARDEAMRQATMLGNVEPLLNPTLGMRGQVWFHPPRLGTLLHRGADILGHPAVTRTGRVAPETLNLLLRLAEPEWNPELNRR